MVKLRPDDRGYAEYRNAFHVYGIIAKRVYSTVHPYAGRGVKEARCVNREHLLKRQYYRLLRVVGVGI